jgi:hypothetical protein
MTRLEAMAQTSKRFTNLMDNSVIPSASVLAIINYYEFLIDSNPVEIKYQSGIEANFAEQEIQELLTEEDYWDEDVQFRW